MKRQLKTKELQKVIEKRFEGVLFGSRAFGVGGFDSDYDYLVDLSSFMELRDRLSKLGMMITDSLYYLNSFYVSSSDGGLFNVVTYCSKDKIAWLATIEMLKKAPMQVLGDKNKRQLVFESVLAMLKKLL